MHRSRRHRDDGMRTARRGWRPKNFLDARNSPKKFTVRKALRVYVHSERRRRDTYLVLPLVFSPAPFQLPQQRSLSSLLPLSTLNHLRHLGSPRLRLCLISSRYFLPRLHFSQRFPALFSFVLSFSLFAPSLFPAAIRAFSPAG